MSQQLHIVVARNTLAPALAELCQLGFSVSRVVRPHSLGRQRKVVPRISLALVVSVTVAGCQSSPSPRAGITISGGDGLSRSQAVIIRGRTDADVIDAEYPWLGEHYPGCKLKEQRLLNEAGRVYDGMTITTADGKEITVYFDITSGYGKW